MTKHERPWLEGTKAAIGDTTGQVDPTALPAAANVQPEAAELKEGVATMALHELAATSPVISDEIEQKARQAEAACALGRRETARPCGIHPRLIGKMLATSKLALSQMMSPDTLVSGAYITMAVAYLMQATNPTEVFIAAMHMAIAMIYLIRPHVRKYA